MFSTFGDLFVSIGVCGFWINTTGMLGKELNTQGKLTSFIRCKLLLVSFSVSMFKTFNDHPINHYWWYHHQSTMCTSTLYQYSEG